MQDDLAKILKSASRRLTWVRAMNAGLVYAVAGGLLAAGVQGVSLLLDADAAGWAVAWPIALLPAGWLAGAGVVAARGVSPRQAAVVLDALAHTDEQLTTAVELAESDQADSPAARCVSRQAAESAARAGVGAIRFTRRTNRLAAATGLVAILCAVLAMLPRRGAPTATLVTQADEAQSRSRAETMPAPAHAGPAARTLRELSQQDRQQLARVLLAAADAEADTARAKALRAAADAILGGDESALANALAALQDNHVGLPETLQKALTPPSADAMRSAPRSVAVYDPEYAKALSGSDSASRPDSAGAEPAAGFVSPEDAWQSARRRANESLRGGSVPPEYRSLVRNFFLDGE